MFLCYILAIFFFFLILALLFGSRTHNYFYLSCCCTLKHLKYKQRWNIVVSIGFFLVFLKPFRTHENILSLCHFHTHEDIDHLTLSVHTPTTPACVLRSLRCAVSLKFRLSLFTFLLVCRLKNCLSYPFFCHNFVWFLFSVTALVKGSTQNVCHEVYERKRKAAAFQQILRNESNENSVSTQRNVRLFLDCTVFEQP